MRGVYLKDKTGNKVVTVPYYRIGDLFLTSIATNPSSYLGGTWELFGPGRCLVCVDTSQMEFNSVKKTGGSKTNTHKHGVSEDITNTDQITGPCVVALRNNFTANSEINILQPFITCYVWIRTA